MKRIFTLAFSIFLSTQIFATAEFFLKINLNGNFTVSLNNQTLTSNSSVYRFFDLQAGNYWLKIKSNGYGGRVYLNQQITIIDAHRSVAELDRFGLKLITQIPYIQSNWYIDNLLPQNQPSSYPYPNQPCNNYPNYPNTPSYPNYPAYQNGGYGNGYGNIMQDNDMQSLIQTIKGVMFEDKKIEIIKTALKNKNVQTSQVQQLLKEFSFDQNKLEVAKYCYNKTVDSDNYYTLYNQFAFNNTSTQLDKYIHSK